MTSPSFYAIIPANVRYCKELEPSAKLLFGEITALSDKYGYCFAGDAYFAELYSVDSRTIQRWLTSLKDEKFIEIETTRNGIKSQRKILIVHQAKIISTEGQKCPPERTKMSDILIHPSTTKKNKQKKAPAAPPITLNPATKKFEGITTEDLKLWQETFSAVNVRKELERALLWALTTPRINYRKSINTWMRNVDREHTTAFKPQNQANQEVSREEMEANRQNAKDWESAYEKKRIPNYDIQAKPSGCVEFCMPNGTAYSVSYEMKTEEFLKKCRPAIQRMKLNYS